MAGDLENHGDSFYVPRQWSGPFGGEMNFSVFTFHDVHSTGVYESDDRPFVFAAVVVTDSDGSFVSSTRSNISGFANFIASTSRDYAAINREGHFTITVAVPPGWHVTTDNRVQEFVVKSLPGAPADLINSTSITPVGLSPNLEICGHTRPSSQNTSVIAFHADERIETAVNTSGRYSLPVRPGRWTIHFQEGTDRFSREVVVGNDPVELSLPHSVNEPGQDRKVLRASFDDLTSSGALIEVPNGYLGFSWNNVVATHRRLYGGEGYVNGATSGEYIAYNGSGHPISIFRDNPFDFFGGDFSAAWFHTEGETLNIVAWRGENIVHRDNFALSALGPKHFDADYRDVTRIEFFTTHYWQVVIGHLEFGT